MKKWTVRLKLYKEITQRQAGSKVQ
uniref:Uncharacterized protein n=1 Tax=Arundo donax TaxID=35708 RepID=A0A0A9BZH8_ARUDO